MPIEPKITRREFIRTLTVIGATTALLPMAALEATPAPASNAKFVPVGKAATFTTGDFHKVTLPGGGVAYVTRLADAKPAFRALSAVCTHKGCIVNWNGGDKKFHCPCHRGQFDATGKNIAGPPPGPLASLPTKVVNGVLMVQPPVAPPRRSPLSL